MTTDVIDTASMSLTGNNVGLSMRQAVTTQSMTLTGNTVGFSMTITVTAQALAIGANAVITRLKMPVITQSMTLTGYAATFVYRTFHRLLFSYQALRTLTFSNDRGVES